MPWSNQAHEPQLPSVPAPATEGRVPGACAPQQEKPLQWETCAPQPESNPCSLRLEEACLHSNKNPDPAHSQIHKFLKNKVIEH